MSADQELVSIREAARRLGVSDTALHKALKAGRISFANPGESRPKLAWPQVQTDFEKDANPFANRRGVAQEVAPKKPEATKKTDPIIAKQTAPFSDNDEENDEADDGDGPNYYKARAEKTHYQAQTARLEYEEKLGRLIDAETVAKQWAKLITAAKTVILGIPAACKTRVGDLPLPALAAIDEKCREALEALSNDASSDDYSESA